MIIGGIVRREHAPRRFDPAQLDVERDQVRSRHHRAGCDPLSLERPRTSTQQLELSGALRLVACFVGAPEARVSRSWQGAGGGHAAVIRGDAPVFKARAALVAV